MEKCYKLKRGNIFLFVLACSMTFLCALNAEAHRDDYLDETLVYLTLEHSEVEAEYWFDYGTQSEGSDSFVRHNIAFEWGITDHWMIDFRGTVKKEKNSKTNFDAGRLETRYRLSEEGALPIDIAFSGEVNWQRNEDGPNPTVIEPRIILSKDLGEQFNVTLNLSEEISTTSNSSAFNTALGIRDNWSNFIRFGSEFQYDTLEKSGSMIPQIWFAFPREVTVKIGYSIGFDQNLEDFGRIAFEMEF